MRLGVPLSEGIPYYCVLTQAKLRWRADATSRRDPISISANLGDISANYNHQVGRRGHVLRRRRLRRQAPRGLVLSDRRERAARRGDGGVGAEDRTLGCRRCAASESDVDLRVIADTRMRAWRCRRSIDGSSGRRNTRPCFAAGRERKGRSHVTFVFEKGADRACDDWAAAFGLRRAPPSLPLSCQSSPMRIT